MRSSIRTAVLMVAVATPLVAFAGTAPEKPERTAPSSCSCAKSRSVAGAAQADSSSRAAAQQPHGNGITVAEDWRAIP